MIKQHDLDFVDKLGMYKIYDKWPEIAETSFNSDLEEISFDGIDHIVFAGMGGSGAIGDLFSSILSKSNIHVSTVKGYILPKTVDKNTLVITTSVSGNTDETLTVLSNAKKLDCNLIAFSSGGKMEEFCKKTQINFRKLNLIHSPRASFLNFTYSILKTLGSTLPIEKNGVLESIREITNTRNQISSMNLSDSNPALTLANWISGIPLIYYPHGLESSSIRFKASLQENAKTHVIIEDVIEACHNGIVSWERPSTIQPILLRGQDDYIKTKERFEIVKEYFIKNDIEFKEIFSVSGNILTKLINLIYLLDYTSIYCSILSGVDPTPVDSITFIKNRITNF
jgi:glucose/mannose-6-phosphate isomerase